MDTNKLAGILAQSKKVMRRADDIKNNGKVGNENQSMADVIAQATPQAAPQAMPQMENYNMGNTPPPPRFGAPIFKGMPSTPTSSFACLPFLVKFMHSGEAKRSTKLWSASLMKAPPCLPALVPATRA